MKENLYLVEDIVTGSVFASEDHDKFFMKLQQMRQRDELRFNVRVPVEHHYQFYIYCNDEVFEKVIAHIVMTKLFFRYEQLM